MARLSIRLDAAMEQALAALTEHGRTKTEAVRFALLRAHRAMLIEQARSDASRLASDPGDRAEMLAIQRHLGLAE